MAVRGKKSILTLALWSAFLAGASVVGYLWRGVSPYPDQKLDIVSVDPISDLIAALDGFVPARDDTENLYRLYQMFRDFRGLPGRDRAMQSMYSLLERFPDADLGSPGPLVHELEAMPGYRPLLRESLRRQPSHLTAWMASRCLNTELPSNERELWLSELRAVLAHPL